jgi:hypothetical protein
VRPRQRQAAAESGQANETADSTAGTLHDRRRGRVLYRQQFDCPTICPRRLHGQDPRDDWPHFYGRLVPVGSEFIRLQIWDITGHEKFKAISWADFWNGVGAVLVFNPTDLRPLDLPQPFSILSSMFLDLTGYSLAFRFALPLNFFFGFPRPLARPCLNFINVLRTCWSWFDLS